VISFVHLKTVFQDQKFIWRAFDELEKYI